MLSRNASPKTASHGENGHADTAACGPDRQPPRVYNMTPSPAAAMMPAASADSARKVQCGQPPCPTTPSRRPRRGAEDARRRTPACTETTRKAAPDPRLGQHIQLVLRVAPYHGSRGRPEVPNHLIAGHAADSRPRTSSPQLCQVNWVGASFDRGYPDREARAGSRGRGHCRAKTPGLRTPYSGGRISPGGRRPLYCMCN